MSFPVESVISARETHAETEDQRYPIGFGAIGEDGMRRFHYAHIHASAASTMKGYAVHSSDTLEQYAVAGATVAVGDMTITANAHASYDVVANQFANGLMTANTGSKYWYSVKSNTACSAAATYTVELNEPMLEGVTTSEYLNFAANPFANVFAPKYGIGTGTVYQHYGGFLGLPMLDFTADYYGWIQTWGPCAEQMVHFLGASANEHELYFNIDGSVIGARGPDVGEGSWDGTTGGFQRAGFIYPMTYYGSAGQDNVGPLVFCLTIMP